MSRKKRTIKKNIIYDKLYNNTIIAKLINNIMLNGKKSIAQRIVYGAFVKIEDKINKPAIEIFNKSINNIMPLLEVKSKRVGGATYQVPIEIGLKRRYTLAIRWLIICSRNRHEKNMINKLANELLDAFNNIGESVKKRQDMHKMAEANKAFAHYKF